MKKVGRWIAEVTCPLCFNIYLCNYNEIWVEKETGRRCFYCPDCNRNLYLDIKDTSYIKDTILHYETKGDNT